MVCLSATAFGTYSLFAILGHDAGIGPISLLYYRFTLAALILAGSLFVVPISRRGNSRLGGDRPAVDALLSPGVKYLQLIGLGALYVGQSFTYLKCLLASDPITASLLLYLYPAFVTVASVLFLRERLTGAKIVALACAISGSLLILGPVHQINAMAAIYGLGTAIFYAAYLVCGKSVLVGIDARVAALVIISTAAATYGIASIIAGFDIPSAPSGWIGPIGLAIVATVIAISALLAGLSRVTPVEASSLSALEPLVSTIIAVLFLGTRLQIWHVAGGALVIVAVLVLARR